MQVLIYHIGQAEPDRYFIAGGFSFTHENGVTDLSCPEAVKLEDIDVQAVREGLTKWQAAYDSAVEDSREKAEALISLEVHQEMASALKL